MLTAKPNLNIFPARESKFSLTYDTSNIPISVSYTHLDVYKRQFVEYSRPIVFGEVELRGRGSLPETFLFSMANDKSRKFKQDQIRFCILPYFFEY